MNSQELTPTLKHSPAKTDLKPYRINKMSDQNADSIIMPPPKRARLAEPQENSTLQLGEPSMDFTEDYHDSNPEFSYSNSKYENFVDPEEVERLKEFQVLDEVKSNDEDSDDESDSSDGIHFVFLLTSNFLLPLK